MLARNAVDDAQRVYDRAVDGLNRASSSFNSDSGDARQKAIDNAKKGVETAQRLADDAELLYKRAVDERNRAAEKAAQTALQDISDAETKLTEAQTELERAETNYGMAQRALTAQTNDTRKALDFELQRADLDIASANIDLRAAQASLAAATGAPGATDATSAMGIYSDVGIVSDYSGVVTSVEKNKGQFVTQGERIATIGISNHSFTIEIFCPESEGRFIEIGDEAGIRANTVASAVKAIVYEITPVGDTLKINLVCETKEFSGGEYATVKFHKQTEVYETIVPNEAVTREATGSFVWVIRNRQGALGMEYYSIKVKVLIADMDDYYTAISKGMEFLEPVAVSYNKNLTTNGRVDRME